MRKYLLVLLCLSIFLSEIILRINEIAGFFIYSFLISGCLLSLSRAESLNNHAKLIIVFMILPIIRIAELFVVFEFFWKVLIIYLILFFLVSFYSIRFKINPGWTKEKLWLLPLVIVFSAILGYVGNVFFNFEGYPELLLLIPLIAYADEVLFRGLIQNYAKKSYGAVSSILFTALLYGIFSMSYGFPAVLFIFFMALIMGLIYNFTRNIFLTIVMNMVFHVFLFLSHIL